MPIDPFDIPHLFTDPTRRIQKQEHGEEWEESLAASGDASAPRAVRLLFDTTTLRWILFVVAAFFVLLVVRLFVLQVAQGVDYRLAADENRFREIVTPAARGLILDADRDPLALNMPLYDVAVVPVDLPDRESEDWNRLLDHVLRSAQSSEEPPTREELEALLVEMDPRSYVPQTIVKEISREEALRIQAMSLELPGVEVVYRSRRLYEGGSDFAHLLGYVGSISREEYIEQSEAGDFYLLNDVIGKNGLESYYESELRGQYGRKQVEVDSLGTLKSIVAEEPDVSGESLILSIDKDFQAYSRERLQEAMDASGSKAGSVVAMDPRTGDILALVSLPAYDPNLFSEGISQKEYTQLLEDEGRPLFHRAVMGTYPPGSTVKPMVGAIAIDAGVVDATTTVEDRGQIRVQHEYNPEIFYTFVGWNRSGLGVMDFFSAVAKSSDIYFYVVSGGFEDREGLGKERLAEGYRSFGLGSPLGIDLPSEAGGLVPTEGWKREVKGEAWYRGDTYHMGIGQGDVLTTPLQVASWTATLANGGTIYQPRLVRKLYDVNTDVTRDVQPVVLRERVVTPETAALARQAMRQTVLDGSGRALQRLSFSSAGKTGTAQYAGNTKEHAWYTGFAPYEDPEIVVTVLVEGGGGGDETAVPVAGDVLNWYMSNKDL